MCCEEVPEDTVGPSEVHFVGALACVKAALAAARRFAALTRASRSESWHLRRDVHVCDEPA